MGSDRFRRALDENGSDEQLAVADVLVTGAELLDRLEGQTEETARLRGRLAAVESALEAERKTRRRLGQSLEEERAARLAAETGIEAERDARIALEEQLETCEATAVKLHEQVTLTWAQLSVAERELAWARRPVWRKVFRLPPVEEEDA
ncbi:MAG TPA: hypothetical protein VGF25_09835 [Thermoleophilaceae bacterium]|jgi:hypothetical protein